MTDNIDDTILEMIKKYDPKNTQDLVEILVNITDLSEDEIVNSILSTNLRNKIMFLENNSKRSDNFFIFLLSRDNAYFWVITTIMITSIASFYLIDHNSPFILIRYLSNLLFVFFIPGFIINKFLFREKNQNLDEIVMGSMIISILLISAIGTIFFYSFIGLDSNIILLVISSITTIFLFLSLINNY